LLLTIGIAATPPAPVHAEVALTPVADIQQKTDVGTVQALGMFLTHADDNGTRLNFAAAIDWQSPDPLWLLSVDGEGQTIGSWADTKIEPKGFTGDGQAGFVVYGDVPATTSMRGPHRSVLRHYLKNGKRVWSRTVVPAPADSETEPTHRIEGITHLTDGGKDIVVATIRDTEGNTCLTAYQVADGEIYSAFGTDGTVCLPTPKAAAYTTDRVVVDRVQPVAVTGGQLLVAYANHYRVTWNGTPPTPTTTNNKSYVTSITHNVWVGVASSDGTWQGSLVLPFNSNFYTKGLSGGGGDELYEVNSITGRYRKLEQFRASVRGDLLSVLGSHDVTGRRFFYNVELPFADLAEPSMAAPDDEEVDRVPVREVLIPENMNIEHIVQARSDYYLAFGTQSSQPTVLLINADTLNIEGEPETLTTQIENFSHRSTVAVEVEADNAYILSSGGGSRLGIFKLPLEPMCGPADGESAAADPYRTPATKQQTESSGYNRGGSEPLRESNRQ